MNMDLKTPCPNCPFRTDTPGYLRGARMESIIDGLYNDQTFTCHKTTVESEPDENGETEMVDGPNAQHCAGALIFLEHQDRPTNLMRVYERLNGYDRSKLDMDAPVPDCEYALIEHHELAEAES